MTSTQTSAETLVGANVAENDEDGEDSSMVITNWLKSWSGGYFFV